MNKTLAYYNRNASKYIESTRHADMRLAQGRFLSLLAPGSLILDFGCGSGRDARYFLEQGFRVEATDGSAELAREASARIGIPVRQMLFQELDALERYDGIWACASVLHLPKNELRSVLEKMAAALRPEGSIYMSFKYGDFEGERGGRHFTDFTEESFGAFLKALPELQILEHWVTEDVRPERSDERWLNLQLKKG